MGVSVQFVGRESVLKAFEKMNSAKWALFTGKAMNFSYAGDSETESRSELEDWLTIIRGNTTGIFTLKFYDESVKTIRPATEEIGSFNFRLSEEQPYQSPMLGGMNGMGAVERLFEKLNTRMDEFDKTVKKLEKPEEDKLETWEKLLDHPVVMAGIGKMFDLDINGLVQEAAKLSGVPGDSNINETIDRLRKYDPDIDRHLYKLSMIAEKKNAQFKTLLGLLEQIAV